MAFGLRYFAELRSKHKEVFWRTEIAERGYTGAAEEMSFDGGSPLSITWERRGDEFYIPVKGSEATINILCTENFHYINLFTADPRKFRVSVYRNTKLYWRGYVVADLYSENFTAPPYQVSIKAVDGFNLLGSVPFFNLDNSQLSGCRSLWELMSMCFDLLELEVDVADWMDLYAEGMNEAISPLRQVYIDMERFYFVYAEPTYRDVLELCLRPFAGQIFQSNGALHIRRTISLYNDNRPMSFYSVGTEFPSGWLIAADGRHLETHTGDPIITESTRERIESMWENDINVQGTSVMDIVPALRKVTVQVKNKMLQNLVPHIGIYNLSKWNDPYEFLSLLKENSLRFSGDSSKQGYVINHSGYYVHQCSYKLTIEFTIQSYYRKWSTLGSYRPYGDDHAVKVEYGFKIVNPTKTMWLQDDGMWSSYESTIIDMVKISTETTKKIETSGIPQAGQLIFFIKQTMIATSSTYSGTEEACEFRAMSITMDTGNDYEDSLKYEVAVNRANNVDMAITLPIADIPNIPNDQLIYSLYFTDAAGKPTRMWRSKGGNDYNSLINHLVACALKYKQLPSRRISGEMFTGKHIDMNTVVQDDKFLRAGFYVNSIELNTLVDEYNSELVEMPKLLQRELPPDGDDCIFLATLGVGVVTALRCENQIILHCTNNKIYRYDTASESISEVCTVLPNSKIYPADSSFVVVDGAAITVIDYRGVVMRSRAMSGYEMLATYMGGYLYTLIKYVGRPERPTLYYYMNRPEYKYAYTTYRRGYGYDMTYMYGDITTMLKAFSSIAINTDQRAYLHDRRSNMDLTMYTFEDGTEILSLSDYFICINHPSQFRIYRRDTISFADRTLVKSISGRATMADHTLGEVTYLQGSTISIWTYRNNTTRTVKNISGTGKAVKGLFYINGELHIVRENQIFKYISNGTI